MPRKKRSLVELSLSYDAVVLGSGPAGEGAAMKLAKSGKRVAIVDVREQLGGNCAHVGTIPSKKLYVKRYRVLSVIAVTQCLKMGDWRQFTMKQVLQNAHKVIQQQVDTHSRFYDRNKIDIYRRGRAYVQDQNTVLVFSPEGIKETIMCKQIVIATGSRPYRPAALDFNIRVYSIRTKFLDLDYSIQKSSFMVQV